LTQSPGHSRASSSARCGLLLPAGLAALLPVLPAAGDAVGSLSAGEGVGEGEGERVPPGADACRTLPGAPAALPGPPPLPGLPALMLGPQPGLPDLAPAACAAAPPVPWACWGGPCAAARPAPPVLLALLALSKLLLSGELLLLRLPGSPSSELALPRACCTPPPSQAPEPAAAPPRPAAAWAPGWPA
jgi:hypothetical protein